MALLKGKKVRTKCLATQIHLLTCSSVTVQFQGGGEGVSKAKVFKGKYQALKSEIFQSSGGGEGCERGGGGGLMQK